MKVIENIDFETHDIKWLHTMDRNGLLKIDHSFQRHYVWIQKNQIQLLETILLGFSVPEIYLWNIGTDPDTGNTEYSIVDGQQRCGAIINFINGNFKLRATYLDKDSIIYDRIKEKTFENLDDSLKQAIWSYKFSFKIVREQISKDQIRNMFNRLNSGNYTLNPQELRHAEFFDGKFLQLSEEISDFDFWKKHEYFSAPDMRRMKDVSFVSSLLIFLRLGIEEEITATGINKAYELYNESYPQQSEDKDIFKKILHQVDRIIDGNNSRIKFLKSKVHLYSLFTALYPIIKEYSDTQPKHIKNYQNFIDSYEEDGKLKEIFGDELYLEIEQYKLKSKEGTSQKNNRLQRLAIIQKILNFTSRT